MRDRRTELRFGADQPAVVWVLGSRPAKEIPAKIVEASKSGLRLILEVPIEAGAAIKVEWERTALVGEARHCRKTGPNRYSLGMKITEVISRGKLRTQAGAA
jgi:hypothetical protein